MNAVLKEDWVTLVLNFLVAYSISNKSKSDQMLGMITGDICDNES